MDQAEGEDGLVFIHCHVEAISADVRAFLKTVFAAATVESEEWCVGDS